MADWLLIRFPYQAGTELQWLVADAAGRIVTPLERGTLVQASPAAIGRKVAILVPAADVLRTESEIPLKAGVKLQQVVPYALEESVAEDIDELHFATGRRHAGGRTAIAVVARRLMNQWLDELATVGVRPDVMVADADLLPVNPARSIALLEGDAVTLRVSGSSPVTMQVDLFSEALQAALPAPVETVDGAAASAGLLLYTGAVEWHRYASVIEPLRERVGEIQVQLLSGGPLALFAQQLHLGEAINLLQGSYAPLHSGAANLRRWRIAAMLLAAVLGLHVAGKAGELVMLKSSEKKLDESLEQALRQALPGEPGVAGNARRRMESQLVALRENQSGAGFLGALGALAEARQSAPDTKLEAINYRPGAIDLKLAAPSAGSLDKLSQTLRANGWTSDLTSGNVVGSGYEGRIQVKPPGAS